MVTCSVLPPCRVASTWSSSERPADRAASTRAATCSTLVLTTSVCGGAPLRRGGAGEPSVADRGEVHTAPVRQVDPRVLRDRGQAGHAGHDLEVGPAADAGGCLVGDGVVQEGIAGDESDHPDTGFGVLEDDPSPCRRTEWLAGLGQPEGGDLGVRPEGDGRVAEDLALPLVVQDHHRGVGQGGDGSQREQIGVTGTGADVDDPTLVASGVRGLRRWRGRGGYGGLRSGLATGRCWGHRSLAFCSASTLGVASALWRTQLGENRNGRLRPELPGICEGPDEFPPQGRRCGDRFRQVVQDRSPNYDAQSQIEICTTDTPQLGTGPDRCRAARFQGGQESPLCKGFRASGKIIERPYGVGHGLTERFVNLQREGALSGCWDHVVDAQNVCREACHRRYRIVTVLCGFWR